MPAPTPAPTPEPTEEALPVLTPVPTPPPPTPAPAAPTPAPTPPPTERTHGPTPAPFTGEMSDCQGDRNVWNAGYGHCSGYAPGSPNYGFCARDMDVDMNLTGAQVCSECGACLVPALPAAQSADMPMPPEGMPAAQAANMTAAQAADMPMPPEGMPAAQAADMPMAPAGMPSAQADMPMAPAGMPMAPAGMPSAQGMPMAPEGMPSAQAIPMAPAGMPTGISSVPATPAPTAISGPVSASGDPHMVNVHGQKFDILRPGVHVLLQLPRGTEHDVLLRVEAHAAQLGGACADIYFQALNMTGRWVREAQGQNTKARGLRFHANKPIVNNGHGTTWMSFGRVELKVVWGHTKSGLEYLNLFARRLSKAGMPIGGLLGLDDHTAAATPSARCKRTMTLLSLVQAA